jgi:hypothetical protein
MQHPSETQYQGQQINPFLGISLWSSPEILPKLTPNFVCDSFWGLGHSSAESRGSSRSLCTAPPEENNENSRHCCSNYGRDINQDVAVKHSQYQR